MLQLYLSEVVKEMLQATREIGVDWLTKLFLAR